MHYIALYYITLHYITLYYIVCCQFGHGLQQMLTVVPYSELAGQHNIEWDTIHVCAKLCYVALHYVILCVASLATDCSRCWLSFRTASWPGSVTSSGTPSTCVPSSCSSGCTCPKSWRVSADILKLGTLCQQTWWTTCSKVTYEYSLGDVVADMMDNLLKGNLWIFIRGCCSRHDGQPAQW